MSEMQAEPSDFSRMLMAEAEKILQTLMKQNPELIDEALLVFKKQPVEDFSKLLFAGEVASQPEEELDEWEEDDLDEDEPELIEASEEDIETIMRELLDENPEFEELEEDVRRKIVVEAVYSVLAQEI